MNWLAHVVLAGADAADQVGGVAADLVTAAQARALPADVRRGIALHHAVDGFTDTHPVVGRSCQRLYRAGVGLPAAAAGVAVDMLYDHLLARRWPRDAPPESAGVTLAAFAARFYAVARPFAAGLPDGARLAFAKMSEEDWFTSYRELALVRGALVRIRARLSPRAAAACPLERAADVFAERTGEFEEDFALFWPELARHAETRRRELHAAVPG